MLLDICFGTRTAWKLLFVFGEAPGKAISRKEIRSLTKSGNKVVTKFLKVFENFGIVTIAKIGKAYYYKLNLSNPFVEALLPLLRLEKANLNNLDFFITTVLREFVYELMNAELENILGVILFGSYAKRTYTPNSDIDVAIILKERKSGEELVITEIINSLNKRFGKEIQPHYYTKKEFEVRKDALVKEILKDGITLM
ncbi:MAG: nucleotidyltransferase domain-containing protein [Candidatus Woesearchaeota archaeon]